jgi:DtxR family Mn-dependent transcriptional regulator
LTTGWMLSIVMGVLLLIWVFLPRVGLLARLKTWRVQRRRAQVEDALKDLLDFEHAGRSATPELLAGALHISLRPAAALITHMQTQGLVEPRGAALHLTAEGERWALHIARAHRLWERYLADEARMPLPQVHAEAHRREHTLSAAELNALDAALGHPQYDPHGDPIPNQHGQLPRQESTSLTDWQTGRPAVIVHLEDEPAIAYQQILAAGLRLGQPLHILEITPASYLLSDGETEYRLAPAVAANVFVASLPDSEQIASGTVALSTLAQGQSAEIVALDDAVQGFTRRRFLDLGLTPGTPIYPELKNFFGDPRAYRVRGTLIALRNDQAQMIWVRAVGKE